MKRFVLLYILFAVDFQSVFCVFLKNAPTLGFKNTPRLVSEDMVNSVFKHKVNQNHSVLFYDTDFGELYVGGSDFVFRLDVNNRHVLEEFNLTTTEQMYCQDHCENVITVIEKFQDSLFVCGTNGHKPQCWKLFSAKNNLSQEIVESYEGTGISPYTCTQNSLSLTVDEDLYAVAPLESDGTSLQFRRSAGRRTNVWMYDKWVSEPTFISASCVKREDADADNDKIYIFFREKNSDHNPEADPWISRVARVCKVDEGGSKRFFQNMWTSFIKARLVCGFPEESLYFNRLQDIYVMNAEDWRNTRVYALFTSSWNSTAVCIYTVGMIEEIFENSTFKGYDKEIPNPRPGTCVKNSKSLPLATINMVKDYSEMTDWVHSVHYKAPFYLSSNNYTKITVDRVQAANNQMYNVLFLATDSGRIHKVLEAGSEPFIISETQLSNHSAIQSMKLDTKKKKLVVGFPEKISAVDIQKCEQYNKSCAECVLARDPYCAWTTSGCTPTVPKGIQNIMTGESSVCPTPEQEQKQINRSKRETASPSPSPSPSPTNSTTVHSVPLGVPFYLSCPIDSYHADYTWEHEGQSSPCLQMQSNCLHLIPAMAKENYGSYECVSKEKDYTKVVQRYHLEAQVIQVTKQRQEVVRTYVPERNNVPVIVPPVLWLALGLAIAGLSQQSEILTI